MSWLRIDDGFIDHPKVLEGGSAWGDSGWGASLVSFWRASPTLRTS